MKKLFGIMFAVLVLVMVSACGSDESSGGDSGGSDSGETVTWKLGHLSNEDHMWHKTAEKFAELANEKTDGKLEVEIYPNEELGGETEVLNGIDAGTVDMTISGETMANWAPKAALMAAPYAFEGEEHMKKVVEGDIGTEIEESIKENVGVTPLYYHMRAPRNLTSNEPINSPEDLNGFKMRVPNVPLFMDSWEAAGASPQVMDFSEVFTALQQGVINGQENPVDLIHSAGFSEVQQYVNETEHVYSWIYVVVGNDQLNSLSEENQEAVKEAAAEAQKFGQDLYDEEISNYTEMLKEEGMEFNSDVDKEAFAEAMKPAIEESLNEEQLDLYQRILDAAEE
ncbi:TRAP transporter substrate-binding protein [Thalassobacillus sp. CUG 92003]|uniref:TRAP transporter substrate-binding protein n=1 Tax=Thalassobacillus sp. CUG 92003 TaxID=2736641 RepID=UPI0015E71D29|nr:TRAP transporter substrate-binding protein [Thalassobacillus sp. CUG 92003]